MTNGEVVLGSFEWHLISSQPLYIGAEGGDMGETYGAVSVKVRSDDAGLI